MDALAEDARALVTDKEALTSALQGSHELHTSKLDALEDTLIHTEMTVSYTHLRAHGPY